MQERKKERKKERKYGTRINYAKERKSSRKRGAKQKGFLIR